MHPSPPKIGLLLLDIATGFAPIWLSLKYAPHPWMAPLTAAFVVIGHCYPAFAQFRGGKGLACSGGCLLAQRLARD
jgi:glycerol-3-phosphate acyltransferase PlsY